MKNLLLLQSATSLRLVLETDQWLAMANEIRCSRFNVRSLTLIMLPASRSEATEAVKAVTSAIRLDRNLEHLKLAVEDGFSNEAGGALAEALTAKKTLRMITLSEPSNVDAQSYNAFSAMLRVNTNLVLELPPFETGGGDGSLRESRKQMIIEQQLNKVGRGKLLSSSQTTREEWVNSLHQISSNNADDSPTFQVSCLYSLLCFHPAVTCVS
jgi:hypothetical protein